MNGGIFGVYVYVFQEISPCTKLRLETQGRFSFGFSAAYS
jgi:hypothetical protein